MDLLKLPSLQLTSCVFVRAPTPALAPQTNSKAEEADDASGAATAPTDNEVCL